MQRITLISAAALLLCCLSSCISIKSEYPEITYYNLQAIQPAQPVKQALNGVLLVRQFLSHAEYSGENMLLDRGNNEIDRLYYHRWVDEPATLVSDMLVQRCLETELFQGGVVQGASQVLPDYFVEGRVIELIAGDGRPPELEEVSERVRGWARVRVHFSLVRIDAERSSREVALQRIYEYTAPRPNTSISSIAPAVSLAAGNVVDQFIEDMASVLR